MKQFTTTTAWASARAVLDVDSVGFVPTMGVLHDGHRSLVVRCVAENSYSVVSIFVNPSQFDESEDLENYPSTLEEDLRLLRTLGIDAVLLLQSRDLYADGYSYRVIENQLSKQLCGAHRSGHFDGVLTVVMKLLNLVGSNRAYFGEKDYQQLQLVRGMVRAFFMDTQIVACPVIREADGLAMSSRNMRLDSGQRKIAPMLYREICRRQAVSAVRERLKDQGFDVEYVEDLNGRRLAAASLGTIRLIDNVPIP